MKIAINTIPLLSPLTGVGNYIYHIARSLRVIDPVNDYTYFYGYYSRKLTAYYNENRKVMYQAKELVRKMPIIGGLAANKLGNFVSTVSPRSFDLYFEPNFIPINIRSHYTIVTIFDFSVILYPEWHPQRRIHYFKKNFGNNLKRADRIIVISDYIKKEAMNFGLPEEKLKTIHLGYDREAFKTYRHKHLEAMRKAYSLPENFMLFVGSIEPRKNLENLVRAYISLDEKIKRDIKLVLAGFKGWQNEKIVEVLKKTKSDVFYLGYLPNTELGKLYNLATLFIYPSIYEGFGLPPLEAMACGCPVVVSNAASLPEVCGDAAQYVDPHDVTSIAEGIARVLSNEALRRSLIAKGLERSRLFSWEQAARKHLEVFEDAAEHCCRS
jgi:glycosyltransferase involved in cell wall biosynthesis